MPKGTRTLKVRFTGQQMVFLEMLRAEGKFGDTMEEVVRTVMREQVRATLAHVRI